MSGSEALGELTWKEVYHQVVPLMRVDNRTNVRYIALEYALMALVLGLCSWCWSAFQGDRLGWPEFVPIAALGMFAMGALQHRLSGLAHDASHYTLFRHKLANELASDLLLMFPIFAMTQKFRNSHLGHHRFVNDPEMDPDVVRLNAPELQRFPVSPRGFVFRYVVKALWPPSLLRYLFGQAKGANARVSGGVQDVKAPYRFRVGRVMRGTYWLTVLSAVHALHAWPIFFLFWVAPLLTFYPMMMQIREIAHHSNAPDDGKFTNSRVFFVNPLLDACVFPYGQAFHVTHHLFAMLPHHQMLRAHNALMRFPGYRDQVVICHGFFFRTPGTDGPSVVEELSRTPRPGDLLWDGPPRHRVEAEEPVAAAV